MFQCARCDSSVRDGVQCSACKHHYDFACAGISEAGYRKLGDRKNTWRCSNCKSKSPMTSPAPVCFEAIMAELKQVQTRLSPLDTLVNEVREIKSELLNLKTSIDTAHKKISSIDEKILTVDGRISELEKTKSELITLQMNISKLERESNARDQWNRMNNIEIKGIPFTKSENLLDMVLKIGSTVDFPLVQEQINFVTRVPSRNDNKIKPIIVSFVNRYCKENFIASSRSFKSLSISDLNLSGKGRVYINDHLTTFNKSLLARAKETAKERGFLFIWVKHCKVHVRKDTTSPVYIIHSERDLRKMC